MVKKEDLEYIQMCVYIYLNSIFIDNVILLKKILILTLIESR